MLSESPLSAKGPLTLKHSIAKLVMQNMWMGLQELKNFPLWKIDCKNAMVKMCGLLSPIGGDIT